MLSTRSVDYINRKLAGTHIILMNFAGMLESEAKRNAKWKDRTSHARQSLHAGVEGRGRELTLYLSHGVKYGKYLEKGIPPHVIRPKNKKALYWRGAAHPVKKVRHPGTQGYPIIEDTLRGNKARLERNIINWWANE
jgi:hypothetical protein